VEDGGAYKWVTPSETSFVKGDESGLLGCFETRKIKIETNHDFCNRRSLFEIAHCRHKQALTRLLAQRFKAMLVDQRQARALPATPAGFRPPPL
jgi:hypothetical protein